MADEPDDKRDRVIQARRKLRDRFLADIDRSASIADPAPQGTGPANRHGMPRLPIDQVETRKWPVLDLGGSRTSRRIAGGWSSTVRATIRSRWTGAGSWRCPRWTT